MNKIVIIGLLAVACSAPTYAACVASSVIVQLDIHSESGGKSQQDATVTQDQDPSCMGLASGSTIVMTHVGPDAAKQTGVSKSSQRTPTADNRLNAVGSTGANVTKSMIVKKEVSIPNTSFTSSSKYLPTEH